MKEFGIRVGAQRAAPNVRRTPQTRNAPILRRFSAGERFGFSRF